MSNTARVWSLQEAKAKFSELVRRAQSEGPQRVTLHGKHVVTVVSAKEQPALALTGTGHDLIRAMQACPDKKAFAQAMDNRLREPVVLRNVDLE